MNRYSISILLVWLGACCVHGIMFNLLPNTQKCLREEIQANQPVMGEYEATDAPGQKIDYIVSYINTTSNN